MKIKTVLIAMCTTALLFSSCEKAEMDKGGTGGGGMLIESNNLVPPQTTTMGKGGTGGGGMLDEFDGLNRSRSSFSISMSTTSASAENSINVLRSLDIKANLGVVSVKITNSNDVIVYSNNVNTEFKTSLLVARSQFASGNYSITISDKDGVIIEQDSFTIE